jgi:chemotaxis protein MotB
MSRHRKPQPHVNHERWLVSYADFITLMFAFFVVMFASAQTDRGKANRVSESVRKALDDGQLSSAISGILGSGKDAKFKLNARVANPGDQAAKPGPPPGVASLQIPTNSLKLALKPEIDRGEIQISLQSRGLVISLREAGFFGSGDDSVYAGGYSSIDRIAQAIQQLPNAVRLEGHTDAMPIHNSRFRSNWELSAARSVAMLQLLESRGGGSSQRMAIVGYAETVPVESNDSEQGRAHNRRVDIVILNEAGTLPEPTISAVPPAKAP